MILSWCKILHCSQDVVLYDISFANLALYSAAMPRFDDKKDEWDDKLDACNPDNFKDLKEEFFVR